MGAPVVVDPARPTLRIRGTSYPVLLPTLRDPRLHLAAVIVSLQVLGQVAFDFRLSIAQILVALLTCAVLEVGITFKRQRVVMWPASALLTGNGVAFILRVPGTEHGDWWSMHGWWIFAGTAAVALLSKYVIRFRGRHVFNPSNIGLVLCFLLLGPELADPLEFWWGPMSPWMVLTLAIIIVGGLAILSRLRLLEIAVGFWLAFAAGIAVLAASGHEMTARWHLGPISGWDFWQVLVFSPEILVFLFFMISDPKTIPEGRLGRRVYAVGIALLAVLLIAPQTTEFATKVAVLAALALVCAGRPLVDIVRSWAERSPDSLPARATDAIRGDALGRRGVAASGLAVAGAAGFVGLVILVGIPARPSAAVASGPAVRTDGLPDVTVTPSVGVASQIDRRTALKIANDVVTDLRIEAEALIGRDLERARAGAGSDRLAALWQRIDSAGTAVVVPEYHVEHMRVTLELGEGQGPPIVVADLEGTIELATYTGSPAVVRQRRGPTHFEQTLELALEGERYVIVGSRGKTPDWLTVPTVDAPDRPPGSELSGIQLADVADQVGLDFQQGAFRFRTSRDPIAMMGGGLCWIDYDDDGWLDLFVVNSYSIELDVATWKKKGGLPRSALFHNEKGRFVDVSRGSGADLAVRGSGCVAADLDRDGRTDLYVTAATEDALLWNKGDGTFVEGARAAGIDAYGWHAGAAVGDVNGDGRPDLFVAGYADLNAPVAGGGPFPTNYAAVRDRLYLNIGLDTKGQTRFREVGLRAGIEKTRVDHGLGVVFTDVDDDGRVDLYVANDMDPNRLYVNVPWPGGAQADPAGLGFRLEERGRGEGVDDPNAGMGVASADYDADGRPDLFVTNSHRQLHAVYRSARTGARGPSFADARPSFATAFDTRFAGWGVSWVDLDIDGNLDVVLANGAIPVKDLALDAEPIQVLENLATHGRPGHVADVSGAVGLGDGPRVIGRGLAAADYDNDGDVDVAINSIGGHLVLLRNTGATGRWLEVELGRFAPGAKITAVLADGRRLVREVHAGSSYLSSEDPRVHFGLGRTTKVRVLIIERADGSTTRLANIASDQILAVEP
ncbi:MAG: FG-GAP-like repeat-containing protein [Gaiellaceae bacterium]